MPEENVDPIAPEEVPEKPRRIPRRSKKKILGRRKAYMLSPESSLEIKNVAKYIRRPGIWVFEIVAKELALIERMATVDLMNKAIEKLRTEALALAEKDSPKEPTA